MVKVSGSKPEVVGLTPGNEGIVSALFSFLISEERLPASSSQSLQ